MTAFSAKLDAEVKNMDAIRGADAATETDAALERSPHGTSTM